MILVTTPTGKIGSQVVKGLLDAGEKVRVIVRDGAKLPPEIRERVEVVEGSHDDVATVAKATEGADRFFLLVPPSFTTKDGLGYYMSFTTPLIEAIKGGAVKRVVAVSASGRNVPMRAGVVSDSHAKDEAIEKTGVAFRALWCPGFYENMLRQLGAIKNQGAFFQPGVPDLKTRHCATTDIAAQAVKLLTDRSWSGQGGVGVFGPEDLSFNEIAAIMTDVLGMPVRFQPVPYQAYKAQLVQYGASEAFAESLVEMHEAKDKGLDNVEPRTAENTTPTSFREWCEDVLKPAVEAA
jgi:uncharacterized protein YbjT (DUF2867 family)